VAKAEELFAVNISGRVLAIQGDYRDIPLEENAYDVITAGTTLHHLREDQEWESVFTKVFKALKPGGTFWINDIVIGETDEINRMMLEGWLSILREQVSPEEIEMYMGRYKSEDSPRTLSYQLNLMKQVGFLKTIVLHKHFNFAAFGAIK